jgi:hypothetical protein
VEQIASLSREGQAAFVRAKVDGLDETFIAELANGVVACVEVVFGHHSERADGGQRTAVLAVQLVDTVPIDDQLTLLAAWQIEVANQSVARVVIVSVPVVVDAGAAIAAIQVVVLARIVPSGVRHRPSFGAQLAPVGLSVKTPWQCLRGVGSGKRRGAGAYRRGDQRAVMMEIQTRSPDERRTMDPARGLTVPPRGHSRPKAA